MLSGQLHHVCCDLVAALCVFEGVVNILFAY
ncbi:hypothetical protein EBL_c34430 [Shimwellia blattae DSM 4481 = NBRC 105725]|uniref:Uncharacterized protein n=1 Tax=Shimwellia blattae (strain ATCC 29907 / DSM 4481 / JCM 1650 / NBRC 105725 / CDC 9005-74) TaxID=630626 RepID=I2BD95_SHIBC|nr:hypothetical protein EBL_c34430 [Shimwellia blattae DSM 4481 = NBRC 105725]